jgi:hypothetical protein
MTRTVGGTLDLTALAALTGDDARMRHFRLLTLDQQQQSIRRLSASGLSVFDIAAATQLSVEQIQDVLGPPVASGTVPPGSAPAPISSPNDRRSKP